MEKQLTVKITAHPWDSEDECEVFWTAALFEPGSKFEWMPTAEWLMTNAYLQKVDLLGELQPVEIKYNDSLKPASKKHPGQHIYIYAGTVKRPNTTWHIDSSAVIRSNIYVLGCASQIWIWRIFALPLLSVAGTTWSLR